ncbi:MAG: hypothetical protein AB7G76_03345 [Steroidobacteraceae bacterium]
MNEIEPRECPATSAERDPYEALDDLMCVLEELCPRWPPRPRPRRTTPDDAPTYLL